MKIEHVRNWLAYDKVAPRHMDSDGIPPGHSAGGDGGLAALEVWRERRNARRIKREYQVNPVEPWRVLFRDSV